MCITIQQLAEATEHIHPMAVRLVSRGDGDGQLYVKAFGSLAEVAGGSRVVAASIGQSELMAAAVDADSLALSKKARLLASRTPGLTVETLNEVVALPDHSLVLDYGAQCVEQVVLNNERSELWLMVACAVTVSPVLQVLAEAAE
jgi:hypothetical protein